MCLHFYAIPILLYSLTGFFFMIRKAMHECENQKIIVLANVLVQVSNLIIHAGYF